MISQFENISHSVNKLKKQFNFNIAIKIVEKFQHNNILNEYG